MFHRKVENGENRYDCLTGLAKVKCLRVKAMGSLERTRGHLSETEEQKQLTYVQTRAKGKNSLSPWMGVSV